MTLETALTAPPAARTILARGVHTHVTVAGAGAPVLFLHGAPDSADMWTDVIGRLSGRFQCFAADLPGFGRSAAPADFDYALENQARWVDELVAGLGITAPLTLVMHDFGGHFGLAWAIRHPDRVRRLVISNTSFFSDYRWHAGAQFLRLPLLGELGMRLTNAASLSQMLRAGSPHLSDAYLQRVYAQFTAAVRRSMLRLYRASDPRRFQGWETELRQLTAAVPALVVWGDLDPYAPPHYAERFGARRVQHFPAAGHWVPVEAAAAVAEQIDAFA